MAELNQRVAVPKRMVKEGLIRIIECIFARFSEHAELVKLFFQYNSDTDWANIFTNIYNSFPEMMMIRAFRNLDGNSAKLLSSYLTGGDCSEYTGQRQSILM